MTTIDPKTHRRLAPHEILREGDEFCDGFWCPTTQGAGATAGVSSVYVYRRKIRPSPKPGYRWADAGEEATQHLIADGDVVQRLTCFQDRGRERSDAPLTRFFDSGAVMPWPEDPRLTEPVESDEKQSREEREREAWDSAIEAEILEFYPPEGVGFWSNAYGVDALTWVRDALNHRLRELGVEK